MLYTSRLLINASILSFGNKCTNRPAEKASVLKANEIFKKTQLVPLSKDIRDSKKIYNTSAEKSDIKRLPAPLDGDAIRMDLSEAVKNKVQDADNSWDKIFRNTHKTLPLDPDWDKKFWESSDKKPKQ